MIDLIDRDGLSNVLCAVFGSELGCSGCKIAAVCNVIDFFPSTDAAPVVHAYWMDDAYCSNCRAARARPWAGYLEHNANTYCHVCGAKMDGGADDGTQVRLR